MKKGRKEGRSRKGREGRKKGKAEERNLTSFAVASSRTGSNDTCQGREDGRKGGRKKGRKNGRTEERKEGRKEERRKGRMSRMDVKE